MTPLVVTKRDRLARLLPLLENIAEDTTKISQEFWLPTGMTINFDPEVAVSHAVPSPLGHEGVPATPMSTPREGAARPQPPPTKMGPRRGP